MDTGFIGLGTMGRAMAANLLKAGHHVRVWNRSQEPVRALAGQGATACASPTEAFQAGVVISVLADDAAVRQVLSKDVLANAPRSAIHVNMATISVALAKELAQVHAEHGLHYVAAPVDRTASLNPVAGAFRCSGFTSPEAGVRASLTAGDGRGRDGIAEPATSGLVSREDGRCLTPSALPAARLCQPTLHSSRPPRRCAWPRPTRPRGRSTLLSG